MVERIKKSVKQVCIACKLPNGVILQVYEMRMVPEATPTGTREVKMSFKKGPPVVLNKAEFRNPTDSREAPIVGGYALTWVDADWWEEWVEQNPDSDLLANKVIFACNTEAEARTQAKEQRKEKVKSGLEPLDPKALPKVGIRGMQIVTYDKQD